MSDGEVCFINIGPKERAKRMRFGVIAFAAAVLAAVPLVTQGYNPLFRLLLFLPFAAAGTGFFQARDKT